MEREYKAIADWLEAHAGQQTPSAE